MNQAKNYGSAAQGFIAKSRLGKAGNSAWSILGSTKSGKAAQKGFMESFGWIYDKETSHGFLGLNKAGRSAMGSAVAEAAAKGESRMLARLGHMGGGLLGAGFMAYSLYSGYQEGGIMGAIREGGSQALNMTLWGAAETALSSPIGTGLMIAAGVGYAGKYLGDKSIAYARSLRNVTMGAPIVDPFGTVATMRQRSLNALQNTHINGRISLGQEAVLMNSLHY